MFPLKSIWPTERIDFILPRSSKVNNKCLRTFQIIVWLMSQLSQNSLGIASHQLQGWEGVNLQLCQQGPLHTMQSQQHPRQGWSSLHRCLCFPWHTRQLLAGCMALLWLMQVALPVQCSCCSALPRLPSAHQTCWAAQLNPHLPEGSLTQAVTQIPDPSSAWGKGIPGRWRQLCLGQSPVEFRFPVLLEKGSQLMLPSASSLSPLSQVSEMGSWLVSSR